MAVGRRGRDLIGPLLAVNLVVYLVVLGLAGWSFDKYIDDHQNHLRLSLPTSFLLLLFPLLAGVVRACSVLHGLVPLRAWRSDSLAAAGSLASISWAITALAFGLVCKEIILEGHTGTRLVRDDSSILLGHLLYVGLLHAGVFNSAYGPGYRRDGSAHGGGITMGHEPQKIDIPET